MRLIATLLVLIFAVNMAQATDYPDYEDVYVNDWANLLDDAQESEMRAALQDLREKTGVEMVTVTIKNMNDYGYAAYDYHPFATGLFNHWGVGDATKNDGVLILISKYDRFARIEVGRGYDAQMDKIAQKVFDYRMLPELKDDNFAGGLIEGVKAMTQEIRVSHGLSDTRPWWQRFYVHPFVAFLLSAFGIIFSWVVARSKPVRAAWRLVFPKKCKNCRKSVVAVSEFDLQKYLTKSEDLELRLKSKTFKVYDCANCGEVTKVEKKAFFCEASTCIQCKQVTMLKEVSTSREATSGVDGLKQEHSTCENCGYDKTREYSYSYRSSSSSSSGGGGGFGGGSSSGGGGGGRF